MRLDRGVRGVRSAIDDELQFHFDMTVSELRAKGLDADAARHEAERRFGDVARTRTRLETIDRAQAGRKARTEWWSGFAQDLRYALRGLRLRPGFAAAVIVTLGLGIGANATMFGIVDRLLFRPPRHMIAPERTHRLYFATTTKGREDIRDSQSYARFTDMARFTRGFDVVAAYSDFVLAVGSGAAAREVGVGVMSASFWRLFDASPVLGRFFDDADDIANPASRVVVLSYDFWQTEFGGDPDVIGKTLSVHDGRHTIIGVAPRGFTAAEQIAPAVFIPMAPIAAAQLGSLAGTWKSYNARMLAMFARRAEGVSSSSANDDLTAAFRKSIETQRAMAPADDGVVGDQRPRAIAGSILEQRGPYPAASTRVAAWLLGVSTIVLLIACANVGNLLLGRALKRRREIAVRMAIGIGRRRLVAQLLIESGVLALFGGAAGLFVAQFAGSALRVLLLPTMPTDGVSTDPRVLIFSAICAISAGALCGLAPVLQSSRLDIASALKAGGSEGIDVRSTMRNLLLVLQTGLSVLLLVGAGLFVRSMLNVRRLDMGYDAEHLLAIEIRLRGHPPDSVQRVATWNMLLDGANTLPGVSGATAAATVPFEFTLSKPIFVRDEGGARRIDDALIQIGSAGYFTTVGTRIVRGRGISAADVAGGLDVAVVAQAFAAQAWPGQDPIDQCIRVGADSLPCRSVVGIAADVHMISRLASPPDRMIYLPATQYALRGASLLVRTRGPAAQSADAIRSALQPLLSGSSYLVAKPVEESISPVIRSWRLGATMFVVFGGLALGLAAIGLYSVVAYRVAQRTHEVGVRLALGARRADILSMIVGDGIRLALVGVLLGIAAAVAAGRWISPLLFNVSSRDASVLTMVPAALIAVATVASLVPALRATRVDPSTALRGD
jgi:predicted permease